MYRNVQKSANRKVIFDDQPSEGSVNDAGDGGKGPEYEDSEVDVHETVADSVVC